MSKVRGLYIVVMSAIVVISGCLGNVPDASGGGNATTPSPNTHPVIESWFVINSISDSTSPSGEIGWNVTFYHAMTDWDGVIVNAGYDIDLDGVVDYPVSSAAGFTTIFIANTSLINSQYYNGGIASIVFGALDDDGAWGSSEIITIELPESAVTLNTYTADDADDAAATGADDTLILLRMTGVDELAWSFVSITLMVGDNVYTCSISAGDDCDITQSSGANSAAWEASEFVFLSEGTADICDAQGCSVDVSITYQGLTVAGENNVVVN